MAKSAWGIELGTSSVKAVKMNADKGSATLEEIEILSLQDFGLGSSASEDDATAGALNDLRVRKGIKKGDQVFVSISGQNTLGRIISLPPVPKERIRETIQNEARSQIPIKLEEAVWDYQVIEDDEDPDELKVNLYAAKREAVDRILGICESAGIQATGIQVAPLGIYNYIKYEMDDTISDCCVAIDIGADNTDVVIVDGQKTYVRVVPVAGNDITKALRARFKLNAEQAEKLKRNAGKSKDAAAVFEAMKPPLKEMVGEIYRAVGFYKSQNDANINQLVMMGNGSKLLNIKKFFEQQLQFQVHKVDTPQRIGRAGTVDPGEIQSSIQSLTVAIGLALQGLSEGGLNYINLVPPEYIEAKAAEKLRVPFFAAGGLAAGGGLIALLLAIFSTAGVDNVTSQAKGLQDNVRTRSSDVHNATNVGDQGVISYSIRNLFEGEVGRIPGRTIRNDDGDEIDVPPTPLYLPANAAPGIISEAMTRALDRYQRSGPRTRVYFASIGNTRSDDLGETVTTNYYKWIWRKSNATWRDGDGEVQMYQVGRNYGGHLMLASELSASVTTQVAHSALQNGLVGPAGDAFLREELINGILKELDATGQISLEDMSDAEKSRIEWTGLNIVAVMIRPPMLNLPGETFRLEHIVTHPAARLVPLTGMRQVMAPEVPATFGMTRIDVRLTLAPVAPLATGDEEESAE